jgi:hypothetical protein
LFAAVAAGYPSQSVIHIPSRKKCRLLFIGKSWQQIWPTELTMNSFYQETLKKQSLSKRLAAMIKTPANPMKPVVSMRHSGTY